MKTILFTSNRLDSFWGDFFRIWSESALISSPTMMNETDDCVIYIEYAPDPTSSIYVIAPFILIYTFIFVLGIVGNVAILYTTLHNRTLQSVQNLFLLNLSASDIIVCLLSLPITPVASIYKNWHFGAILCRLIPCVQGGSVFIFTYSLTIIAVDRYILVMHPHRRPISRQQALTLTAIIWILSVMTMIPLALFMNLISYPSVCGQFCTELWPNETSRRAYTLFVLTAQFVAPFVVMTFCYATIFYRLRSRAQVRLRRMDERLSALERSTASNEVVSAEIADKRLSQVL